MDFIEGTFLFKIIFAVISFIINGLFLIVLAKNKDLLTRKRITYHVANLAVADTLYGLSRFCLLIVMLYPNELTVEMLYPLFNSMCCGFYLASLSAVLFMSIERSIVITKPLAWKEILPRKRMLLFMFCSWIAVTLHAVLYYFSLKVDKSVEVVMLILQPVFLLSTAAVNIYLFKSLRKKDGSTGSQHKSTHLKHKASILVLLVAVIMIFTCLPNSLLRIKTSICLKYNLLCNMHGNIIVVIYFSIVEDLNFFVNPLVYTWRDRMYRNAFYRTFKMKTQF